MSEGIVSTTGLSNSRGQLMWIKTYKILNNGQYEPLSSEVTEQKPNETQILNYGMAMKSLIEYAQNNQISFQQYTVGYKIFGVSNKNKFLTYTKDKFWILTKNRAGEIDIDGPKKEYPKLSDALKFFEL